jgi:hypothetical protein
MAMSMSMHGVGVVRTPIPLPAATYSLPFKGRLGEGMGSGESAFGLQAEGVRKAPRMRGETPYELRLAASPLKGEVRCDAASAAFRLIEPIPIPAFPLKGKARTAWRAAPRLMV